MMSGEEFLQIIDNTILSVDAFVSNAQILRNQLIQFKKAVVSEVEVAEGKVLCPKCKSGNISDLSSMGKKQDLRCNDCGHNI